MRWFKHLSMAHDDVGLSTLLEAMGPEAYGIYWLLLEHFASVMEKDCTAVPELIHSEQRWATICHTSSRKFRKFAEIAAELKLIESKSQAELKQFSSRMPAIRLAICIPKLLKYRDEYSRKSGHSPDKLPARTDTDGDTDTDTDTDGELKTLASSAEALPASEPQDTLSLVSVSSPEPHIGTLPLVDGSSFGFTKDDVGDWSEAYPAVDVLQQLREMREWCKANPKLRKTRSGIRRYVTTWLAKEQDKAGGGRNNARPDAVLERQKQNLANIEAAAQRLEDADGTSGGFLSQPDTPTGNAGRLPPRVEADRGEVWGEPISERIVERSAPVGLLSIAEGYRGRM
jgi:hypothetical protein